MNSAFKCEKIQNVRKRQAGCESGAHQAGLRKAVNGVDFVFEPKRSELLAQLLLRVAAGFDIWEVADQKHLRKLKKKKKKKTVGIEQSLLNCVKN